MSRDVRFNELENIEHAHTERDEKVYELELENEQTTDDDLQPAQQIDLAESTPAHQKNQQYDQPGASDEHPLTPVEEHASQHDSEVV